MDRSDAPGDGARPVPALPEGSQRCWGSCCRWIRGCIPVGCLPEVKELFKLAAPMIVAQMLLYLISLVSCLFCGHLGKVELDAVTIANAVIAVTGVSVGIGFSSACDTLLSQTFGSKNLKQVGVILQRALLTLILICFPCWALFINTENLLLLVGQDPEVARLAHTYVLLCIPVLLEVFIFQLQISFLQNQEITVPQIYVDIIGNAINIILHYVFLFVLDLNVMGAAVAVNIARTSQVLLLFLYIWMKKLHVETWGGWSRECLQEWGSFTALAVPSLLTVCFEWWIYEIGNILAGLISITELGAQSVMYQVVVLIYMIPFSYGSAVSVRVGNALGAGNTDQARRSALIGMLSIERSLDWFPVHCWCIYSSTYLSQWLAQRMG